MNYAIKVENLEKSYGVNKVLKGITFSVNSGEIFALLGINGAGKTTTLESIEGLRKYDHGSIQINGKYGVQLQSSSIPQNMKAYEALFLFSKWQKVKIDQEYVSRLGIEPFMKKQYFQLSTGQKRRLHLALALIGNPEILFLDEPTAGLDVEGRASIHDEIKNLKSQGKTIIIASHDMAEVEELSDRIGILRDGEIAFLGSVSELVEKKQNQYYNLKVRFSENPEFNSKIFTEEVQKDKEYYVFKTASLENTISHIIYCCQSQNIVLNDIRVEQSGIEQRFLEIAKEVQ